MSVVPVEPASRARREGPAVIVLGSRKNMDLSGARPSPIMKVSTAIWQGLKVIGLVAGMFVIVGTYPAMTWSAHEIDDSRVALDAPDTWASPTAGVAITLIAREVEGPGWTGDRAGWRPSARLTAQPAWQAGMSDALADFAQLAASLADKDARTDPDLEAASRLLRPVSHEAMTPRLVAAAEAFARYNGRVDRALAGQVDTRADIAQTVKLFAGWAESSRSEIAGLVGDPEAWPAGQAEIRAFYRARARAQVANNLLSAMAERQAGMLETAALRAQYRETRALWQRVSAQAPLVVSNQEGDGLFLPNHLAAMAWHLEEVETATRLLASLMEGAKPDMALARADHVVITASP